MGKVAKKKTRPAVRTKYLKGTAFDRIKNYYLGKVPQQYLTEKEEELIWRYENVWKLYQHHLKSSVAIKYHQEICKRKGLGVNNVTAWRDFQRSTKLFGKVTRVDRQAKLLLLDDMATDTFIMAKEDRDLGEMNRAISNLVKINEQVEEFMEDSREPHKYELHLHVNGQNRTLDLNKLPVNNNAYQEVLHDLEEKELNEQTFARLLDENEDEQAELQ